MKNKKESLSTDRSVHKRTRLFGESDSDAVIRSIARFGAVWCSFNTYRPYRLLPPLPHYSLVP